MSVEGTTASATSGRAAAARRPSPRLDPDPPAKASTAAASSTSTAAPRMITMRTSWLGPRYGTSALGSRLSPCSIRSAVRAMLMCVSQCQRRPETGKARSRMTTVTRRGRRAAAGATSTGTAPGHRDRQRQQPEQPPARLRAHQRGPAHQPVAGQRGEGGQADPRSLGRRRPAQARRGRGARGRPAAEPLGGGRAGAHRVRPRSCHQVLGPRAADTGGRRRARSPGSR